MRATLYLLIFLLAACATQPTPAPLPAPSSVPSVIPSVPSAIPSVPSVTPSAPSVDSTPSEQVYCLSAEPQSLFRYARPEPGRAEVLAALYPDPIQSLLAAPPEAQARDVILNAGDTAVDEVGRVVTLAAGVTLSLLNGAQATFDGSTPLSAPQLVVTFHLRPNLRWSDGQPLTTDDSVFAFDVSLSPDSFNPRRALAERTAAYRAVDDLTVEWVGLPGYITTDFAQIFVAPLPRHQLNGLTSEQMTEHRQPLTWGPLALSEWVTGDHLTLTRNPFSLDAPIAEALIFRFAAESNCATPPPAPSQPTLLRLDYSLAPADDRAPVLSDLDTRRAIALCLNRAAFTASVPATYAPESNLTPIPFDPAQGRALLATPLTLTLAYGAEDESLALAIENQLESNCGMGIEPRLLTRGELWGDWPEGVVFGRQFDLALLRWNVNAEVCAGWMSNQIASDANPGGANDTGYNNPAFDAACRAALTTLSPEQAARHHAEAQQIFARDLPSLPLFFVEAPTPSRPN